MAVQLTKNVVGEVRNLLKQGTAKVYMMKGAVPRPGELTETKKAADRINADALVVFDNVIRADNTDGPAWEYLTDTQLVVYSNNDNTIAKVAGDATWFLYATELSDGVVYKIGTVGPYGRIGTDIVADSVTTVAGQVYWLDPVVIDLYPL